MMTNGSGKPTCALDIGATAVTAVIGHASDNGVNVAATATVPVRGLNYGGVVDDHAVAAAIRAAVTEVQRQTGCAAASVVVGIDGDYIKTLTSRGIVAVRGTRVEPRDLERVKVAAGGIDVPADRQLLHVEPVAYTLDERSGIDNPLGLKGRRLELEARVVIAKRAAVASAVEVCTLAGVEVGRVVPKPATPEGWFQVR
jgi:cell division protein FtsA